MTMRKFINLLICVILFCSHPLDIYAANGKTIHLSTAEDLLAFAENCRLDSYSQGLTVILDNDIDLTGVDFPGIPTFGGSFEGGRHTISGLSLTGKGSIQGLFRYLQDTAYVSSLYVEGTIIPSGSRETVGGIVGSNSGYLKNCIFKGEVSGSSYVGGIAGINEIGGTIENSYVDGTIHGKHFVGGITGENLGTILSSKNSGMVNTTAWQNSVEIEDITLESLTGTESVGTVTDIGGIAGISSGVIKDSVNLGNVGYRNMGYNIGGIVGCQTGLIENCSNYGVISGRKEVGGIVGQLEPTTTLEYTRDTLQILRSQFRTLTELVDKTEADAQNDEAEITTQINSLQKHIKNAQNAVNSLLPTEEDTSLPTTDEITAAQNTLNTSLSGINNAFKKIRSASQNSTTNLTNNIQAISQQLDTISGTLNNAENHLGGDVTDISDEDTADDLTSKVLACYNKGSISADLNVGGIVGAIALENDLDPEEDVQVSGNESLNFESELRAVILSSTNEGSVDVKRQNIGGIVGWMSMGLVKDSLSSGSITSEDADYVGGIAGQSSGYIRSCSVKATLSGTTYVGGIAGSATVVSDCRSMVSLSAEEKQGCLIGYAEPDDLSGNFYLSVGQDIGGVDGVSYSGKAEPLSMEEFLSLEDIPHFFQNAVITFVFNDNHTKLMNIPLGGSLDPSAIPDVPEKSGYTGTWDDLNETDLSSINFDMTFRAVYTSRDTFIQSDLLVSDSQPLLLAQGDFLAGQTLTATELSQLPSLAEGEASIEAWSFTFPQDGTATQLRFYLPEGTDSSKVRLMIRDTSGAWTNVGFTADGSYLVFPVSSEADALCLISVPADYRPYIAASALGILLILTVDIIRRTQKRRRQKKSLPEKNADA